MTTRILLFSLTFFVLIPAASAKLDAETEEQVYTVLERANRSGDHVTRAMATEAFGPLRPKDTRTYAVDALKDPVWAVRAAAIRALVVINDSMYAEALFLAMTNPKRDMSVELMPVLDSLSDKDALALANKLMNDQRATTKEALIQAFGKRGGSRAIAFFKPLVTHKNQAVSESVQTYILTLRTKEVLPLIELVLDSGTPAMQDKALEALTDFPIGTKIDFVRKQLKSKDADRVVRAAEVLAHHGDRSAVKTLLPMVALNKEKQTLRALKALVGVAGKDMFGAVAPFFRRKDTNPDILRLAFEIHVRAGDKQIIDTVRKFRRNDNIRTQAVAVYYLGVLEKGRALPSLHEDLFHGDPNVRLAAIEAVESIGSRESVAPLGRLLDNTQEAKIKTAIMKALANINDKSIVPIVAFRITDPIADVRKWAIIALTRVRHVDAVSSLKIALNDANIDARAEAVRAIMLLSKADGLGAFRRALGWIPPSKLVEIATGLGEEFLPYADMALTSSRPEIQRAAMEVLKKHPKHEEALLQQAIERTRDNGLKVAIVERLVERNGNKEMTRLAAFVDSNDKLVRVAAIRLMGQMADPTADTVLKKVLFDSDERARVTAAIALLKLHNSGRKGKRGKRKRGRKRK